METAYTQIAVCYLELDGISPERAEASVTRIMEALHEEGAVIDRVSGKSFTVYWLESESSKNAIRNAGRALSVLETEVARLGGKLKGAMTQWKVVVDGPAPPSAAGRALIAHRARLAAELCGLNTFLGTAFLMDTATALDLHRWYPVEVAGKGRLYGGTQPVTLYKFVEKAPAALKPRPAPRPPAHPQTLAAGAAAPVSRMVTASSRPGAPREISVDMRDDDLDSVLLRMA